MNIEDMDTPCLIVDGQILTLNIDEMAQVARLGSKRLRPHAKTHKTLEIARMQMDAGATGITVAKVGEAEVFVDAGITDVFVAHLIVGPTKLARLAALAAKAHVVVGADSEPVLRGLAEAAAHAVVAFDVLLEVDTGHGRAGVKLPDDAARLASLASNELGLSVIGVYTHEGHAYRTAADELPALCNSVCSTLDACRSAVRNAAPSADVVSVGSTPTASLMADQANVSEIRPGNYVFRDATQVRLGGAADRCALTVLATVVARPTPDEALIDAGSKAFSGDRDPEYGYGFVQGNRNAIVDWCSEEHGHLNLRESGLRPRIGDKLRIVPAHACTCVNLHPVLWVADGDRIIDRWPVAARDRLQ